MVQGEKYEDSDDKDSIGKKLGEGRYDGIVYIDMGERGVAA